MKKLRFACLLLICSAFVSFNKGKQTMPLNEIKIKAPFGTVTITVPNFSTAPRIYLDGLGADKEKNTRLITGAIDKASAGGGGVVIIPEGEWLVKTIHFKSNVNLHLELPVENVSLKNITTGTVQEKKHIHENVKGFKEE